MQIGVDDGTRTHDNRDHNPGLYQLSYVHRPSLIARLACPAGLEPATLGLEGRCSIRLSYGHDPKAPLAGPAARGARIIRKRLTERQFSPASVFGRQSCSRSPGAAAGHRSVTSRRPHLLHWNETDIALQ